MKTTFIFLLFLILSTIVIIIFDLLLGLTVEDFLSNIVNTFMVMDTPEYMMMMLLFLLLVYKPLFKLVKKLKKFKKLN